MADEEGYEVVLAPGARRALTDRLPPEAAFAAFELLQGSLAARPRQMGAPLRPPWEGLWRARRGEYRIRYRIEEAARRVVVLDTDHRRDAYRS